MCTLLVGSPEVTWREWIKTHRKSADLLTLDIANSNYGSPGRAALLRGEKAVGWRFVGSTDPSRNPIALLQAAATLKNSLEPGGYALLFEYRAAPVLRHLALAIAQLLRPTEILIPDGSDFDGLGWPVGPQRVILEPAFPAVVCAAQRRARWIELIEQGERHEVSLDRVSLEGTRLGSGSPISVPALHRAGLEEVLHAERFGANALIIAEHDLTADQMAAVLDLAQVAHATVIEPWAYSGLLCSFADQEGNDFGMGMIERLDFERRLIIARCTAIPPAPVRIVRLGSLRIDETGKELGETKPWSI